MSTVGIKLPFSASVTSGGVGMVAVGMLYSAIYLKDWTSQWLSGSADILVLATGLLIGALVLLTRGKASRSIATSSWLIMAAFSVAWMLTLATKGVINMSSYYIAIPCAFVIVNVNPRLFIQILLVHLLITLLIGAFEYFSGQYFFIYQANDGTVLNESLFGGGLDIFRAKGMFQGPLNAVAFAIWIAFLMRGSVPAGAILFLCAFFASGRLGMLTSTVLIGFRLLQSRAGLLLSKLTWLLGLVAAATLLFAFSDENRIFFISSALNLENDQNVSRVDFWITSLTYYLSYGPLDLLFGNYGFIFEQQGGTENDFLRLLLDCGLVGFGLYAGAIVTLIALAIRRRDREGLLIALLIIGLMNIFPFVQSLSSALLFWIYFFATVDRPISKRKGSYQVKFAHHN